MLDFYWEAWQTYVISKIKLVGYHQWHVLIGWATSRLSGDSLQVGVNQLKKQNFGCWIAFCRRPQLYSVKPNWLPVSRHWDFPQISAEQESWRTWRRKSCPNSAPERSSTESRPLLQRCFGRAVKNKTTNSGYRLVWESLNWMIVQLICFPTSYGTIYVCFHSWFCRIFFNRATARLLVSATHHGTSNIFVNKIFPTWVRLFLPD